jgi:hypothetical protein
VRRDGKRVYFTNSLYRSWDDQFYPEGVGSEMVQLDIDPGGGMRVDERFFPMEKSSAAVVCIRSGCRMATPRRTPTASGNPQPAQGDRASNAPSIRWTTFALTPD